MNEYFVPGAVPAPNSPGASATIRAEFSSIATAFDKLPVLAGSANEFVVVNATGTAMIASGYLFTDFVTVTGAQTLTNKTLAWADNTWPGFGSAATKVAGTGAGNVLLLAENAKLPALDGSLLTNLTPAAIGIIPVVNGGTGAATVPQAQINLGIDLKADANNAVLTGAPTCPTPPVGNSSARLANTQFVTDTITAIGAAIPSDATPLMNGVAAAGAHTFVSRDDHVHPVDTSRAPAAASTATGTSFSPVGGIVATNVQAALSELDTEKAPLASPALTGVPTSTTPLTSDNSTRIATTAFMQSLLAQQPPGVEVSDSAPLMNGVVAPGTGVEASRYDHVHPTDTSRAPIASPSFTGTLTHSGDVVLSGSGKRITGDFSNATIANRVMFQTSTPNSSTGVGVIPNGSGSTSFFGTYAGSDPNNTHFLFMVSDPTRTFLESGVTGAGVAKALIVYVGGAERMRVDTNGNVLITSPAGLGYGPGAGGTVTQATSKSNAVTLNKPSGQITMNAASLAAGASVTFLLNSTSINYTDVLSVALVTGASEYSNYRITARCLTGAAAITVWNVTGASLSEAVVLQYVLHKGAVS